MLRFLSRLSWSLSLWVQGARGSRGQGMFGGKDLEGPKPRIVQFLRFRVRFRV